MRSRHISKRSGRISTRSRLTLQVQVGSQQIGQKTGDFPSSSGRISTDQTENVRFSSQIRSGWLNIGFSTSNLPTDLQFSTSRSRDPPPTSSRSVLGPNRTVGVGGSSSESGWIALTGPMSPRQWICREWVGKLGFSEFGLQLSQVQRPFEWNCRSEREKILNPRSFIFILIDLCYMQSFLSFSLFSLLFIKDSLHYIVLFGSS